MDSLLKRIVDVGSRHGRIIAIVAAIWFWAGIAVYARYLKLPDVPDAVKQGFFWLGIAFNAVWWGYFHGAIKAKREALSGKDSV